MNSSNCSVPDGVSDGHEEYVYSKLQPYTPPVWISKSPGQDVPTCRVPLAMTPTPIHKWELPGVPKNFQVYIKRDDLTGCTLTGNKVRKLEFIFGRILQQGYKHVITCGYFQSNHCRAVASVSAQLGITCHLVLAGEKKGDKIDAAGNLFLSQMCDATIHLIPKDATLKDVLHVQQALATEILRKTGEKAYNMYAGGSDFMGLFGYLQAWQEMIEQRVLENFDDVVVVCGTGGTLSGLVIGNCLTGQKVRIHGISMTCKPRYQDFLDHLNKDLVELGLDDVKSEDIVDFIEGYGGSGYGNFTDEDITLYKAIARKTGILCDPGYVGKGITGLLSELTTNPNRFQGNRVLFLHTGGIFKMLDGKMSDIFSCDKVHDWSDVTKGGLIKNELS